MPTLFRGAAPRRSKTDCLRVTVLEGGGHIAEVFDKRAGVNPLWIPPWPSIEPSTYVADGDETYGAGGESQLLSGIMGHNLCLDIFGGPSAEEEAAGLQPHGEASLAPYQLTRGRPASRCATMLHEARLAVERRISCRGSAVRIVESVENLSATDRPVGWTHTSRSDRPFWRTAARSSARRLPDRKCSRGRSARQTTWFPQPSSTGRMRHGPTAAARTCRSTTRAPDRARIRHTSWIRISRIAFFVAYSPRISWPSDTCGSSRISRGWASGKKIAAAGTSALERQDSDAGNGIRRLPVPGNPAARWSSVGSSSERQPTAGFPAKTRIDVEYWIVSPGGRSNSRNARLASWLRRALCPHAAPRTA